MLARSYESSIGSQKFDRVTVDLSSWETAGKISPEQFHHMNLAERTELYEKYRDIYDLLIIAEKGASYGRYRGQAPTL